MGLLTDLLLLPVTGPARSLLFIAEQLKEQMNEELLSESSQIQDELMRLAMRYELGELSEQAYAEEEEALLARLNEIRDDEEEEYWETEEVESEVEVDEVPIESEGVEYTDEP